MGQGRLIARIRMIFLKSRKGKAIVLALSAVILLANAAEAAVSVREITVDSKNEIQIHLDSSMNKNNVDIEFLRDIVQVSLQGASIYPAKIENFSEGPFKKLFAYQYAPNLVRIRFTVDGNAEDYRGNVKTKISGKILTVAFGTASAAKEKRVATIDEVALLNKVLGADKNPEKQTEQQTEKQTEKSAKKESKPLFSDTKKEVKENSASPLKGIFVLMIIAGGLGMVLLWVKKKAGKSQVSAKGNWFAQLIPAHMKKQKGFIEVLGNTPLGPKQNILLVKIRGQQLVLGVTQDRIQLITQLDSDWDGDLMEDPNVTESLAKMFGGEVQSSSTPVVAANRNFNAKPMVATAPRNTAPSFRSEIRKRLEGMREL